jgi:hypothetical protein
MKAEQMQVRGVHKDVYRSGEWADAVAVRWVTPNGCAPRACLLVMFQDGKTDLWPVFTQARHYETRAKP